jgi:hypothetical protein
MRPEKDLRNYSGTEEELKKHQRGSFGADFGAEG